MTPSSDGTRTEGDASSGAVCPPTQLEASSKRFKKRPPMSDDDDDKLAVMGSSQNKRKKLNRQQPPTTLLESSTFDSSVVVESLMLMNKHHQPNNAGAKTEKESSQSTPESFSRWRWELLDFLSFNCVLSQNISMFVVKLIPNKATATTKLPQCTWKHQDYHQYILTWSSGSTIIQSLLLSWTNMTPAVVYPSSPLPYVINEPIVALRFVWYDNTSVDFRIYNITFSIT